MKWSQHLQNKAQIRNRLNDKRKSVSDVERNQAAQQAMQLLTQNAIFDESKNIACYLARTEEFDCNPIIQAIWQAKKNCYLPVLSANKEGHLDFVAYQANDLLRLNRYQILEPENTATIAPEKLDLILLPLVGFDLQGNRLGVGGGYYDRTFEFIKNRVQVKPLMLGLAFEFQQVHQLPADEWDVPLCGVLTEKKLIVIE